MKNSKISALLPIAIFLLLFLGIGIITQDFYKMPAIIAFLIALVVAILQNKHTSFDDKLKIMANSIGDVNVLTMCLIFLAAGAFSSAVSACGGAESVVNFTLSIIPMNLAIPGLFIISCLISLAMGTSMGTIATLAPIALGISDNTGFTMAMCMGAVVGGSLFGDNLSMISDTTIAAVKTQGCEMKDKFKENFLIVLPAAIASIIIYFLITKDASHITNMQLSYNLITIIPYIFVLVSALIGINVFVVLIGGTLISLLIGIGCGNIDLLNVFNILGDGVTSMYDITIVSIVVTCIVGLVKANGGIKYILDFISSKVKTSRQAEFAIGFIAFFVDLCSANNTLAIILSGPIAKEISIKYNVSKVRSASLLDIFASVAQGIIPYGAQLLSAASLTCIATTDIIAYLYYPFLTLASACLFIIFRKKQ